jgi:hypothetical protein
VAMIARVLRVSREGLYYAPKHPDHVGERPSLRLVPPPLPDDWPTWVLSPVVLDLHTALHALARRHPAAGYRKLTSRLRRAGWLDRCGRWECLSSVDERLAGRRVRGD